MQLVEATRDDAATVAEYWYALATAMEQYSDVNDLAVDGPGDALEGVRAHHIEAADTTPLLIEVDGETVGYVLLRDEDHPSRRLDTAVEIVDLFVDPDHRSEGYGCEVVDAVREIARDRGADYVTVGCEWANEGARRFYEDNDFTEKQVRYVQRLD